MTTNVIKKPMTVRTRVNRLTKLRNFIAALPVAKFDMTNYVSVRNSALRDTIFKDEPVQLRELLKKGCGTKCCIGGWALLLFAKPSQKYAYSDIADRATELLGLTPGVAEQLFSGYWPDGDGMEHTGAAGRRLAVKTLDRLIATKGVTLHNEA